MHYLRNAWYLVAWANELPAGTLLSRTIAEQPMVMFRDQEGVARALRDWCPHRFAPLSKGRLVCGTVRCGYHGLMFDGHGNCVDNPHGPVSQALRARSFAVVERHWALWTWLGESTPEPDRIPDLSFIERAPEPARVAGHLETNANYELMVGNIMDLTHADYFHADSLGGGINTRARSEVSESPDTITVKWSADDDLFAPAHDAFLPQPGQRADFRTEVHWSAPGVMRQRVLFGPAGRLVEEGTDSWTAHVMTPKGARSTHYFFCHTNERLSREAASAPWIRAILLKAFQTEDAPMLEAQQRQLGEAEFWSLTPVLLAIDKAAVLVRRRLASLIDAERNSVGP